VGEKQSGLTRAHCSELSVATAYAIRRFQDPVAFLNATEDWLLQAEAENNLIIGIAHQLAAGTLLSGKPVYLAAVEEGGRVVGAAFRTPPYKVAVTRMPEAAIAPLMKDLAHVYSEIPAVLGDHHTACVAARTWADDHAQRALPGMLHRIYQLDQVIPPARHASGHVRIATADDIPLVTQWIDAFSREAAIHTDNSARLATARIRQQSLFLWDDGGPAAMAAWSGETPNGRRVGYVSTPPDRRRRGYATSLVAHVSQRVLDDGCRFCFLYTDLANPTSNSIYQLIGYRPVCDVMDWNITPVLEES
jgi:predicted GNAT family acetyltransferase